MFFYPIVQFPGVSTFVRLKFENLPITIYILELRWVISQDGDVLTTLWCYLASISLIPLNECITIKFSHESFGNNGRLLWFISDYFVFLDKCCFKISLLYGSLSLCSQKNVRDWIPSGELCFFHFYCHRFWDWLYLNPCL